MSVVLLNKTRGRSIIHKLKFTGFRVFLLQKPSHRAYNQRPNVFGMMTYHDITIHDYAEMAKSLGKTFPYYPSPQEFAEVFAARKSQEDKTKYRAVRVHDECFQVLWLSEWYQRQKDAGKEWVWASDY